jgi:catechol 2,3-dioxygenase-like lactoylglutathione lyase family enzyme
MKPPTLNQIDLIARDLEASIAFYRALGVEVPESGIWRTATGIHHVDVPMPDGLVLHFDSAALAAVYDRGWCEPTGTGTRTVLSFRVGAREEVDRIHGELARLGYPVAQPPYDAFWGSRFAIVEDPDGNHVGLMSPRDPARNTAPPDL